MECLKQNLVLQSMFASFDMNIFGIWITEFTIAQFATVLNQFAGCIPFFFNIIFANRLHLFFSSQSSLDNKNNKSFAIFNKNFIVMENLEIYAEPLQKAFQNLRLTSSYTINQPQQQHFFGPTLRWLLQRHSQPFVPVLELYFATSHRRQI